MSATMPTSGNGPVYAELERLRKENLALKAQLSTSTLTNESASSLAIETPRSRRSSHSRSHSNSPLSSKTIFFDGEDKLSPEFSKEPKTKHKPYGALEKVTCKKRYSGVGAYNVIVETSLLPHLHSCVQFGTKHKPSVVFAVHDAISGSKCWSFVKSYGQLRSFDASMKKVLTPFIKSGKFRMYQLPSKDMFASLEPWKVDVRNDMLNAYFSLITDLKLLKDYNSATEIQKKVEQTMASLWYHDILEHSTDQHNHHEHSDMEGCLLINNEHRGEWTCKYCFVKGAYFNIITDHRGKPSSKSIPLMDASVRAIVVFFDTTADDFRYLFRVREKNGKEHYFTAENEKMRRLWVKKIAQRIEEIKQGNISLKQGKHEYKEYIPPYVVCGSVPPGLEKGHQKTPSAEKIPHEFLSRSSSQNSIKSAGSSGISRYSLYDELNNDTEPQTRLYDGDEFYMQISNVDSKIGMHTQADHHHTKSATLQKHVHSPHSHTQPHQPGYANKHQKSLPPPPCKNQLRPTKSCTHLDCPPAGSPPKITISNPKRVDKIDPLVSSQSLPMPKILPSHPAVFGIIPEQCKFTLPIFKGIEVPSVIARCYQCIVQPDFLVEKGIFRISGSVKLIHDLQEKFDTMGDLNLVKTHVDVHTTADLMKRYLRMLPRNYFGDWSEYVAKQIFDLEGDERLKLIQSKIKDQSQMCRNVFLTVLRLLTRIIEYCKQNQMSAKNLGVALSPALAMPGPVLELLISYESQLSFQG